MKFATGRIGWTPHTYYTSSPKEFEAACEGYNDRLEDEAVMFRNLGAITHRSMGGKDDITKIWKLSRDQANEIIKSWTQEEIKEMEQTANKLFASGRLKSKG